MLYPAEVSSDLGASTKPLVYLSNWWLEGAIHLYLSAMSLTPFQGSSLLPGKFLLLKTLWVYFTHKSFICNSHTQGCKLNFLFLRGQSQLPIVTILVRPNIILKVDIDLQHNSHWHLKHFHRYHVLIKLGFHQLSTDFLRNFGQPLKDDCNL